MRASIASALVALLAHVSPATATWTPRKPSPPAGPSHNGVNCTVYPKGNRTDDTPQILQAFSNCNNGGTVVFPEGQNYWIATKLNPVIHDVTVEWKGTWTFSDDMDYWRNNSYPIAFQNHKAGFVITGERIHINGHGTGGIYGNGNVWYTAEAGDVQPGRPMPCVFWNVSHVFMEHFFIKDPPLWSLNIMNGTNMWFDDIFNNATSVDAPYGTNWVANTDGFDTMDAYNIALTNFVYQGGDDCVAIKPRSYNIYHQNVTCHGGSGIAIGSLGQYLEDASVENIYFGNVNMLTHNLDMHNSAYIKTWMGGLVPQDSYESGGLPRGGGWGTVRNLLFENFYVEGAKNGPTIDQDSGDNGSYAGTSKMLVSNVIFQNFTGWLNGTGNTTASLSCSTMNPCYNIDLVNITLSPTPGAAVESAAVGKCSYVVTGGVHGLTGSGC